MLKRFDFEYFMTIIVSMKKISAIFKHHSSFDLTVGKPLTKILLFMLPMLIGVIFQQMYSIVDTAIVGRSLGATALKGVSFTASICMLILGFTNGLTHGFSVIVSQRFGAHDDDGIRHAFAKGITMTVVLTAVLTVVAEFAAEPLLRALNTDEEVLPYSLSYLRVIFAGMLLGSLYNQFAATLRAIGDSFMPLMFLILSGFMNAGMDSLFIMVFDMGVWSAALATVIANGISALLTFIYLWIKYPRLRFGLCHLKPDFKQYANHLKLGVPLGLQSSIISIGMLFSQSALNTMTVTAQTAYAAASKIDGLATSMLNTCGNAAATFVGQNYGARRYDRIKTGIYRMLAFFACVSALLALFALTLYRPLVGIFIPAADQTREMFDYALTYLLCNSCCYFFLGTLCITRSSIQGMGRGTLALFAAAIEVAMRVSAAVIAINSGEFTVVCMNNAMSWVAANCMVVPAFLIILRKYTPLTGKCAAFIKLPNPSAPPRLPNPNMWSRRKTREYAPKYAVRYR